MSTRVGVHLAGIENPSAFTITDPYTGESMLWVTDWIRVQPVQRRRRIFGGPHADELSAKLSRCLTNPASDVGAAVERQSSPSPRHVSSPKRSTTSRSSSTAAGSA